MADSLRKAIEALERAIRIECQGGPSKPVEDAWEAIDESLPFEGGEPVAWLRDAQPEAEDEALVVCAKGDPGSFPVFA